MMMRIKDERAAASLDPVRIAKLRHVTLVSARTARGSILKVFHQVTVTRTTTHQIRTFLVGTI